MGVGDVRGEYGCTGGEHGIDAMEQAEEETHSVHDHCTLSVPYS